MGIVATDGDPKLIEAGSSWALSIINGQPVMDEGLENAVSLSLFTPATYWGNILAQGPSQSYVSRFPELYRRPLTNQTRIDAEKYADEALAWMVAERIAEKITVIASIPSVNVLFLVIKIEQPQRTVTVRYQLNWAAMEARVA